ncbi:MAG: hypothetical protein ACFE0R_07605 [Salinarimonas sp.]
MTNLSRFLAVAVFAAIASPVAAQHVNPEITNYDQPQQQDFFFQSQRGLAPDVSVTGSIARPGAAPFYGAHEYSRIRSEDQN